MDLGELRTIVQRYAWVSILVFQLCLAAGILAAYLPEKTYATSATLVLDIDPGVDVGGASVQQATFMTPALVERAESRTLKERVSNDIPDQFRNIRVDISATAQSSVMHIRGTSHSAQAAEVWVNAVADRLIEEQSRDSAVLLGVLDRAPLKTRPIAPNTEPIIFSSIVVGLIGALFAALATDRLKRAFDTTQTIRDRVDATILGEIPIKRRFRRQSNSPIINLLSGDNRDRDMAEAFENLRANVEFRMTQVSTKQLAIVSLAHSAGKSTLTAGLSYAMADVGQVVAVEADLRRPALADQLDVRPLRGLGDIAAFGYTEIPLQRTSHHRLSLLAAGFPVARPADVLTTTLPGVLKHLDEWYDTERQTGYDHIFLDCPPLVGASESALVLSEVKWAVLVLDGSRNDMASVTEAIERIGDAGASLLGVVVNKVSRRRFRRQVYRSPELERQTAAGPAKDRRFDATVG